MGSKEGDSQDKLRLIIVNSSHALTACVFWPLSRGISCYEMTIFVGMRLSDTVTVSFFVASGMAHFLRL